MGRVGVSVGSITERKQVGTKEGRRYEETQDWKRRSRKQTQDRGEEGEQKGGKDWKKKRNTKLQEVMEDWRQGRKRRDEGKVKGRHKGIRNRRETGRKMEVGKDGEQGEKDKERRKKEKKMHMKGREY